MVIKKKNTTWPPPEYFFPELKLTRKNRHVFTELSLANGTYLPFKPTATMTKLFDQTF